MNKTQILKKPLLTEKTSMLDKYNTYGFIVDKKANKIQIKHAIEEKYGVTVQKVSTVNMMGKMKSRYTKSGLVSGRKASFKKAYVKLVEDDIIELYDN